MLYFLLTTYQLTCDTYSWDLKHSLVTEQNEVIEIKRILIDPEYYPINYILQIFIRLRFVSPSPDSACGENAGLVAEVPRDGNPASNRSQARLVNIHYHTA
jgi:hypothetical protein